MDKIDMERVRESLDALVVMVDSRIANSHKILQNVSEDMLGWAAHFSKAMSEVFPSDGEGDDDNK